jgi:enamine deaminase RidA (YjgF/YER057c/UK114 family)
MFHMRQYFLGIALLITSVAYGQASPAAIKCSSAVDGDGYLYVAGQTGSRADGRIADKFSEQVAQALEKVKTIVEASNLTMDHVVYVQVYLENIDNYSSLQSVFKKYFPTVPPAGAVLGVAKLPGSAIQINAVAVHDLNGRKAVIPPNYESYELFSPGVLTHDRLFVSAMQGRDLKSGRVMDDPADQTDLALDGLNAVAEAAGLTMKHFVFVNPYLTNKIPTKVMNERYAHRFEFGNTPGRATIQVTSLPLQAQIEYTGIAVRNINLRRAIRPKNMLPSPTASPCVFAGETLYCSAKSGFIPGPHGGVFGNTTAAQLRQTMRNQLDNLQEADMDFSQLVSTTVYLDDLSDSGAFNKVYTEYFQGALPAQTLLQQIAPADRTPDTDGHYPDFEQMSLIAVKTPKTALDKFCK